jgi:hypothetical protein
MKRRILLGIAGWLTVAAAATTAGIAAIAVLEDGITGRSVRPLDDEAVHRALSRSGATSAPAAPSRCEKGLATIVAAVPSQGFHTSALGHGPAASVSLTFESDDEEYAVTVTCQGGSPVAHAAKDDGHRGRHRGRG